MNIYSRRPGSSLLEQMMVLGVIIFVAAMVTPKLLSLMDRLNERKTQLVMAKINGAIASYAEDMGHAPRMDEGGLNALIKRPSGTTGANWRHSYLPGETSIPLDGFKKDFKYNAPPRKFKQYTNYELYSFGADGDDDAVNRLHSGN